eukprot:Nk52_evm42s1992 gene=Nk52_evmTU42s1992
MRSVRSLYRTVQTASFRGFSSAIQTHTQRPVSLALRASTFSTMSSVQKDKKLFTPGPLGVSLSTKEAMLRDLGSRDVEFVNIVKRIRSKLLQLAEVKESEYSTVIVQGSGTFAVESVVTSTVPRGGKLMVISNGHYGERISKIAKVLEIDHFLVEFPEDEKPNLDVIREQLKNNPDVTNVSVVHCETSSGVINPVVEIGQLVKEINPNVSYFIDAMSSFGAIPFNVAESQMDFMSSLNKCKGVSRSLSLDLYDQVQGLDKNGQFRFTPATHAMLAFNQALNELEKEGGISARSARYQENRRICREGMKKMGFKELLDDSHEGYIITSYHFPKDPNFDFEKFYTLLNDKDLVIYPGKVLKIDSFRIGNIGHLFPEDMKTLITAIEDVCKQMGMSLPIKG